MRDGTEVSPSPLQKTEARFDALMWTTPRPPVVFTAEILGDILSERAALR